MPTRVLCSWNSPDRSTWVGCFSFSRGSSEPRDWTQVFRSAGRFFTIWARIKWAKRKSYCFHYNAGLGQFSRLFFLNSEIIVQIWLYPLIKVSLYAQCLSDVWLQIISPKLIWHNFCHSLLVKAVKDQSRFKEVVTLKVKVKVAKLGPILCSRVWLYSPWNSLGQNTGVSSLSLLQHISPAQVWNIGLPHCRWILYQLSHKGSPRILEWVVYPFSRGFSWPRNLTGVFCIAGGFFFFFLLTELFELSGKPSGDLNML